MVIGDAHVFPGFLTPELTQLFFPKPPTTFLTCLCRSERRKYAGNKSRLNRGSNSQPSGHESDKLTTEPPGRGHACTYCCVGRLRSIINLANIFLYGTWLLSEIFHQSVTHARVIGNSILLSFLLHYLHLSLLLILSGDIETNPGPVHTDSSSSYSLSIIQLNIRSIRNKLKYISDYLSDFYIMCFTETHLDNDISDSQILCHSTICQI